MIWTVIYYLLLGFWAYARWLWRNLCWAITKALRGHGLVTSDPDRSSSNPLGRIEDHVQVAGRPPWNRQRSRKRVVQRDKAPVKDDRTQLTSPKVGEARPPQRWVRIDVPTRRKGISAPHRIDECAPDVKANLSVGGRVDSQDVKRTNGGRNPNPHRLEKAPPRPVGQQARDE